MCGEVDLVSPSAMFHRQFSWDQGLTGLILSYRLILDMASLVENCMAGVKTIGGTWQMVILLIPGLGPTSPIQLGSRTDWFKNVNGFNVSSLALDTQRKLWGWGQNDQGQLGNNGHISKQTYMTEVSGDHRWSEKIALGKYHCLAIDTDGHLWVWGGNFYGQLGLSLPMGDQSGYRSVPIQLGNDRWVSVAAGQHQSHGVKADGTLWSWGKSKYGRLGINQPYGPKNSPIQVGTLNTWLAVACGEYTGFAIRR